MSKVSKGFAGLINLTSDISEVYSNPKFIGNKSEHADKAKLENEQKVKKRRQEIQQAAIEPRQSPRESNTLGMSEFFAIAVVVAIVLLMVFSSSDSNDSSYSSSQRSTQQSYTSSPAQNEEVEQTKVTQSSKTNFPTLIQPPVGRGKILSLNEIHWCVTNDIFISQVNKSSDTNNNIIDYYNSLVDDYNSRCGEFQYYEGTYERAKRNIEPFRDNIIQLAQEEIVKFKQAEERNLKPENIRTQLEVSTPLSKDEIELIQELLTEQGYSLGIADGFLGKKTTNAIKEFQRNNGLLIDGKATKELLEILKALPKVSYKKPSNTEKRENKNNISKSHFTLGSTQEEVRAIQGTPTTIAGRMWFYKYNVLGTDVTGLDSITFTNQGRVEGWQNSSGRLKVK